MRGDGWKLSLGVALLALCAPGFAGDGVLEINHACAEGPGCFSDDAPGYPVTIENQGSYRLTSSLQVPNQDVSAILIAADDVSIDLGGHSIRGSTVCTGNPPIVPLSCFQTGSGVGIGYIGNPRGAQVFNGTVVRTGADAVQLPPQSIARDLRIASCGGSGISIGSNSVVSGNAVTHCGAWGILTGSGVTIRGNSVSSTGSDGISSNPGSSVLGNSSEGNTRFGITCSFGCTISENSVSGNGGTGITVSGGATITGNTAFGNGDIATDHGIVCAGGCVVERNTVSTNAGFGLSLGANAAYRANVATSNTVGGVNGGVNRGDNHCAGTGVVAATCP
jgi:parallel beta-helix repeat protein